MWSSARLVRLQYSLRSVLRSVRDYENIEVRCKEGSEVVQEQK